jgi:hypothetical protein
MKIGFKLDKAAHQCFRFGRIRLRVLKALPPRSNFGRLKTEIPRQTVVRLIQQGIRDATNNDHALVTVVVRKRGTTGK